jgi:glycosyltransferase involved in cell wall biosynthesis
MPTQRADNRIRKILLVIARLNRGGTAQYIDQLTMGLLRAGYEVEIATGFVQGQEVEDDSVLTLPIRRVPSMGRKISPLKDFKARGELQAIVDDFKPDLIYSHTFKAGLIGRTLRRRPALIHAFHGHLLSEPELQGFRRYIVIFIERLLASRALKLVTVGEKVARELIEVGVGRSDQYLSIPPGVSALSLTDATKTRREFSLEGERRPIVAWLARVTAVKAPERVIELAKEFPEALFIQAGGGDLLEKLQGAPGLENWRLLGWQPASKIWAIADIAISTSENEGMPVALIEAQLAGIPVVALDVGSVSEVVADGESGYVVSTWGEQFFDRLGKLINSSKLRTEFGDCAHFRAREEFDPSLLIKRHIALIKSLEGR